MSNRNTITCPHCSKQFEVAGQFAGKVECPECKAFVNSPVPKTGISTKSSNVKHVMDQHAHVGRETLNRPTKQADLNETFQFEEQLNYEENSGMQDADPQPGNLEQTRFKDNIDRTVSDSDIEQLCMPGTEDGSKIAAREENRANLTIQDAQAETHDVYESQSPARTADSSILESEEIGQTINPRELSDEEASGWNRAAHCALTRAEKTIQSSSGVNKTWVDYQSNRLRKRTVAHNRDEKTAGDDYRLVRKLGQGGMGDVYVARQESLNRLLALKLIKPLDGERRAKLERLGRLDKVEEERRQQFLSEAMVTGDLDHPNIVPIHDVALTSDNELFYSMKRVVGTPWSEVISGNSRDENLEILMKACDAIGFAHERGVVHRDIKPENIMLGDFGVVMVMDWGLALPTTAYEKHDSIFASSGLGGTPSFMAPEMATGPLEKIGPASDIYLLGATLFMIVTGSAPHDAATIAECLKSVRRNTIRDVAEEEKGELFDIAMKAMNTRCEDRYPDVATFQNEIRGYRQHSESISLTARAAEDLDLGQREASYGPLSRASFRYEEALKSWAQNAKAKQGLQKTKLIHAQVACENGDLDLALSLLERDRPEHEALLSRIDAEIEKRDSHAAKVALLRRVAVLMLAIILIGGAGAAYWIDVMRAIAVEEKERALQAEDLATEQRAFAVAETERAIKAEHRAKESGAKANFQLANARWAENRVYEARDILNRVPDEFRDNFEWHYCDRHFVGGDATLFGHTSSLNSACFSPDGQQIASGGADRTIKIWDATTGKEIRTLRGHEGVVRCVSFSPDGTQILSGSKDGTIKIWDTETGAEIDTLQGDPGGVGKVKLSRNGTQFLSTAQDNTITIWDAETRSVIRTLSGSAREVTDADFSPDGTQLVAASGRIVQIWDALNGTEITTLKGHVGRVRAVAFSPDGTKILSAGDDTTLRIWDAGTGNQIRILKGHFAYVLNACFSPDGMKVVSAAYDSSIKLWNAMTGVELLTLKGHISSVPSVSFSPDGARIVSASADRTIKIWDAATGNENMTLKGHANGVTSVHVSPDGERIISGGGDSSVKVWDAFTGREIKTLNEHTGHVTSVHFSPDGTSFVSASSDHTIKIWEADTGRVMKTLTGHTEPVTSVNFGPKGKRIVSGSYDQTIKIWDAVSGSELSTLSGHEGGVATVSFSPDGTRIVSGGLDSTLKLWDANVGREILTLKGHVGGVASASFSPNGTRIVSASPDTTIKIWNAVTGREITSMKGHVALVYCVRFSPDGRRIVSGSWDQTIKVWNAFTGSELLTLQVNAGFVLAVCFSPDGSRIISAAGDDTINVWGAAPMTNTTLRGHSGAVQSVRFSPDSARIVSACYDNTIKVWDVFTGSELTSIKGHTAGVSCASFSPDCKRIVSVGFDKTIKVWDAATGAQITARKGLKAAGSNVWFGRDGKCICCETVDGERLVFAADSLESLTDSNWFVDDPLDHSTSLDGRWFAISSLEGILLVDLHARDNARMRGHLLHKADPQAWWHREQAVSASATKNWYATVFHYGWFLKRNDAMGKPDREFRTAWSQLKPTKRSLLPQFIQSMGVDFGN